jgi:predicted  nucleic acid-binding Zn-ribbon protein
LTVEERFEQLRTLQIVDAEMRALERELEELPRRLESAQQDRASVDQKEKAAEELLDVVLKKRRELEQEIAEADQNVIKYENDKIKVKTNAEFRALSTQIDNQKEIKSGIEDQVLLSFDEEETARETVKKLKEELAIVSRTVDQRENDMKTRAVADEKRLAVLREQRTGVIAGMDKSLLSRYEIIRSGKGVAVVNVMRNACGGCHTQQPPQKVNEIRKKDALHNCDFCGRFLLWGVEETAAP